MKLLWDGPTETDPAKQNEVVETWITRGVDVIAVSVENKEAISTVLRKARGKGIKVVTWDADAEPDARDFFVNQATPQGIGETSCSSTPRACSAARASSRSSPPRSTAANQNEWLKNIKDAARREVPGHQARGHPAQRRRPEARLRRDADAAQGPSGGEGDHGDRLARGAGRGRGGEAVGPHRRQGHRPRPAQSSNKPYLKDGVLDSVVLWNTMDLGYLTVQSANALAKGTLKPGATALGAGRLKSVEVRGDNVLLGTPFTFTKDNVDQFDF